MAVKCGLRTGDDGDGDDSAATGRHTHHPSVRKDHRGVSGTPALQVAWKYEHSYTSDKLNFVKSLSSRRLTHSPELSLRLVSSAHRQVYRR